MNEGVKHKHLFQYPQAKIMTEEKKEHSGIRELMELQNGTAIVMGRAIPLGTIIIQEFDLVALREKAKLYDLLESEWAKENVWRLTQSKLESKWALVLNNTRIFDFPSLPVLIQRLESLIKEGK